MPCLSREILVKIQSSSMTSHFKYGTIETTLIWPNHSAETFDSAETICGMSEPICFCCSMTACFKFHSEKEHLSNKMIFDTILT